MTATSAEARAEPEAPGAAPAVTIIVLNWNGRRHLDDCLESLMALDYPADRVNVVLCDNGSTDGSVAYVRRRFSGVRVVALDANYGFAGGNNRAVEDVDTEWIAFLNNDMHVPPTWLRDMLAPLDDRPHLSCISSRILNWDGSSIDFIGGGVNFQGHGFQLDHGRARSDRDVEQALLFACGGAMLVRRAVFLEAGGFDADYFAFFEDVDLGWRLNLLGHDVWYTPKATAYHRHHGTAKKVPAPKLRLLYERNALFTIYKCFDDENLAAALPAALFLLNEKALRLAHVDPSRMVLGAPRPPGTKAEEPPGSTRASNLPTRPEGIRQKVIRLAREEGIRRTLYKAARKLVWYKDVTKFRIRAFLGRFIPVFSGQVAGLPEISLSHYAALSDFAHSLGALRRKRAWLQEHRRRTDAEILPLFHNALDPSYNDRRYIEFHRWLCEVLGLDQRFGPGTR